MARILLIVLVGGIVVAGAWWLALLPGSVTAVVGGVTLEAPTPVAAIVLVLAFVILHVVLRLLGGLVALPGRIGDRARARHRRQGDVAITRTLLALAAGDAGAARQESARARRLLGEAPQTLMLVAEAARLAGREDEAELAFRRLADNPDAAFLGLRGLLRQAIAREDWPEAAALARQAEAAHPGAAWLRTERAQLAIRANNWGEALALTSRPEPGLEAALATAAANAETDPAQALKFARRAYEADTTLAPAAIAYATRLREAGHNSRALNVVRRAWTAAPHPDLATFALAGTSGLARVQAAKALVRDTSSNVESHLLLARVCLEADLTGEARRHLEAARAAAPPQRRLWLLLADIEEAERGDTEAGRLAQRDALREAAAAEPDPAWRCGACGTPLAAWAPVCPTCATAGRVAWSRPARLSLPAQA